MNTVLAVFCAAVGLASLPGSLTLLVLSLAALVRPKSGRASPFGGHLIVVVPAHNEADTLGRTLANLLPHAQQDGNATVWVIADNCTDHTADIARAAGASTLVRNNPAQRGKGAALDFAFTHIPHQPCDWFLVIDADSTVAPGSLSAFRRAMGGAHRVLQCAYLARDIGHPRARIASMAQWGYNLVRPRGRIALGASAGILGNGFAVRADVLDRVPYHAHSVVEDLEYHLKLCQADIPVGWVPGAQVVGEIAPQHAAFVIQRSRWEGGRLGLAWRTLPGLLGAWVRGNRHLTEPIADLMLLPLSWHIVLLVVASVSETGRVCALIGAIALLVHGVVTLAIGPTTASHLASLVRLPWYLLCKLALLPRIVRTAAKNAPWQRSPRSG